MDNPPPVALTIAGSDSGGGAGIQADLKTFHAFGVFGTSAVTAVTAQNTMGVDAVHGIPGDVVRAQIDAVVDDLAPVAVKSGMLGSAALVATVAERISRHGLGNYVLDPVMVSTSGHQLLDDGAVDEIRNDLMPLATVVTPNLHEAGILTGRVIERPDELEQAGRDLLEMGAQAALIKGGHLEGDEAVDVLVTDGGIRTWSRPRIDTTAGHGTGCTLSAALAAGLALGLSLEDATDAAITFVARALREAPGLGAGSGPINHFVPGLPGS
jgi:hydroxymethylpyrimidine/phosphomethylpyrimidine kinase